MGIFSVYIINKAGGLIYQYDHISQRPEAEKTFSYPLELVLKLHDDKIVVAFGERDGIKGCLIWLTQVEISTPLLTFSLLLGTIPLCRPKIIPTHRDISM